VEGCVGGLGRVRQTRRAVGGEVLLIAMGQVGAWRNDLGRYQKAFGAASEALQQYPGRTVVLAWPRSS
jgi:hypothetical protein